jgi:hypothetical protein
VLVLVGLPDADARDECRGLLGEVTLDVEVVHIDGGRDRDRGPSECVRVVQAGPGVLGEDRGDLAMRA